MPGPLGDRLILRALYESKGDAHAVSEDAIAAGTLRLSRASGVDAAPEGGCALAVTEQLVAAGRIPAERECAGVQHRQRRVVPVLMRIAILDPFSGIAGDMTLGALLQVGLDPEWLRALPGVLGLDDVGVEIREVIRGEIVCQKVDFDIPPQPHGRHIREIKQLVARSGAPERVRELADRAFMAIATAEGEIHGMPPEEVHLHEVGAVDAILDVVGVIWGLELLGVERVYAGTIALGDGTVRAAHGLLPVPAPATLKLLEGLPVRPGPEGSGELVTPTGAALVRVLSSGPPPAEYIPLRSGFGAGTKDFRGRANALRVILADEQRATRRGRGLDRARVRDRRHESPSTWPPSRIACARRARST